MKQPPGLNAFITSALDDLDAAEEGFDEAFLDRIAVECRPFYTLPDFREMADYNSRRQARIKAYTRRTPGPDPIKTFIPHIVRTASGGYNTSSGARHHCNRATDDELDMYAEFMDTRSAEDRREAAAVRRFKVKRARARRRRKATSTT